MECIAIHKAAVSKTGLCRGGDRRMRWSVSLCSRTTKRSLYHYMAEMSPKQEKLYLESGLDVVRAVKDNCIYIMSTMMLSQGHRHLEKLELH